MRRAYPRGRLRARLSRMEGDAGFSSVELVIITPFLLAFLLLVVGFGRVTHGRQEVQAAAAAAARAASLASTPGQATAAAQLQAAADLAQAGISCQSAAPATVDISQFRAGGQVRVTISCVANLADLTVVGFPGHKTLTASATAPLENYREFGDQG